MNISDDIIGFGADETAHNHALQQCSARLEENGLTINRKKCKFYKDKFDFYGLTFLAEGISPDDKKVEAFKNAPQPANSCWVLITTFHGKFVYFWERKVTIHFLLYFLQHPYMQFDLIFDMVVGGNGLPETNQIYFSNFTVFRA